MFSESGERNVSECYRNSKKGNKFSEIDETYIGKKGSDYI